MLRFNEKTFLAQFFSLGKHQRTILKRIVWFFKTYSDAHPSQATIAKNIPCSRKHVNRTIAQFKEWGWVWLQSRGPRRTKRLQIPEWLASLDLDNLKPLMKQEVTSEVTHSSMYSKITGNQKPTGDPHSKCRKKEVLEPLTIPTWVQHKASKLTLEEKLKLSMCAEATFDKALGLAKFLLSKDKAISNQHGYVVGTTIKMQEQLSGRLPWRRYYQTLGM